MASSFEESYPNIAQWVRLQGWIELGRDHYSPSLVPTPEEMRPLSSEEARRFLAAASGDRLEALYVLAVTTGIRRGELLGLKWADVDLENATLSVRRTLMRTDNAKRIALGEPKTKKAGPSA